MQIRDGDERTDYQRLVLCDALSHPLYRLIRPLLLRLDPEQARSVAISELRMTARNAPFHHVIALTLYADFTPCRVGRRYLNRSLACENY
jgi:hypothetical protein